MSTNTLIKVNHFPNGFLKECDSWVGWLQHCGITVTTRHEGGDVTVYADEFNAKAITGVQVADPSCFGNCPAVKKYMEIPKQNPSDKEAAYHDAFRTAFWNKFSTWEERVAIQDAYMANQPINGVSLEGSALTAALQHNGVKP